MAYMHKLILRQPFIARLLLSADVGPELIYLVNHEIKIGQQLKEDSTKLTFLQRLILNQQQHPEQITDRDITTHAFGNITAGSDTTAIAMQSVILNLIRNPAVYRTLCEEVRSSLTELPVQFHRAWLVNVGAVCWSIYLMMFMCFPSAIPVTGINMNYSVVIFVFPFVLAGITWFFIWKEDIYIRRLSKRILTDY